jgi:hypothetical protein
MKEMLSIEELDKKMERIAASVGMSVEKFRKLPRKKFLAICDEYNNNPKNQ